MQLIRKPFEMPSLYTSDDFGLDDPTCNRQHLERLLASPHDAIRQDYNVLLAATTCPGRGEIFLSRKDEQSVTYYMRFQVERHDLLGCTATQVAAWRRTAPGLGRATTFIFDYLLTKFDAVMSDACVSAAGQRLDSGSTAWRRLMKRDTRLV